MADLDETKLELRKAIKSLAVSAQGGSTAAQLSALADGAAKFAEAHAWLSAAAQPH